MPIVRLQTALGRIFFQRCFYLFVSIIVLIAIAPLVTDTLQGRVIMQMVLVSVLAAALAALGKTVFPFVVGLLLGIPAFGFQMAAFMGHGTWNHAVSTACYLAFFLVVVGYLLRYVFNPEVMTEDKLFGAAAAYLLLGVMWTFAYDLVQYFEPQAFGAKPGDPPRSYYDLLYMSFGLLTSNGPGDITPVGSKVRALVILEQVAGTLFVAILIARLAGIYPPKPEASSEQ
jgi:hypothetical protein